MKHRTVPLSSHHGDEEQGVNAPRDLRSDVYYGCSPVIHQTLNMNFNGLRTASPACGPEVTGFQSKSSTN